MKKTTAISSLLVALALLHPAVIHSLTHIRAIRWDESQKRLNIFTSGDVAPQCQVREGEDEIALYLNIEGAVPSDDIQIDPDIWGYDLQFVEQDRSSGTLLKITSLLHFSYRVVRLSGDVGYSAISVYLKRGSDTSEVDGPPRERGRVMVYREPDSSSEVVARIDEPIRVRVMEMSGGWYRVEQIDGEVEGWAEIKNITIDDDDEMELRRRIVEHTRSFLGVEYVTGGTDSEGFDCSGLVYRVYTDLGIEVTRASTSQYERGVKLSEINAKPGDLVFFYISEIDVLHVGIYTGGGKFINSNSYYDMVMEEELSDKYWSDRFYGFSGYL